MNTASIAITVLTSLIVLLALLFWFLTKHFASMNPKERKLYEQGFHDALAGKALDEKELIDELNEIMDET